MTTGTTRPFTGKESLESLRDGREIWIYGERVDDVTTHPAFRNPARMLARLYDALHEPATQELLTCATDTGSGGYTHRYFRAPAGAEDLVKARDAIAAWARLTYGWMGRSRSEEHTSELQSQSNLVCRLLLEKKKKKRTVARGGRS